MKVMVSGLHSMSAVNLRTHVELANGLATGIAVEAAALTENKLKKEYVTLNYVENISKA
jgi:hypothetical protein